MINRIELAHQFDKIIENVRLTRESEPKSVTYWLAHLELALLELKRQSIIGGASFHPSFNAVLIDKACSSSGNEIISIVQNKLFRTLSAYSPKNINPRKASEILLDLLKRVDIQGDPNKACEVVSLRYCGIAGILETDSDSIYLEIILREALGLYGDSPPSPAEQISSISMAAKIFQSINRTSNRKFSVVKKRVRAA